ncbi:hypothetical protein [Sphingomonas sp. CROZ-RG-20F-R02-07]|uniref:hypothetical protein n=1 Tax=Sphingomonas sp. CROZ-RG-20F-R02-07 TaxID=2914832 RepID=UPI001F55E672|nr:hypothetical protein [Sphingomonas sp. CROZ-RG-20F-R02-07]
MWSLMDTSQRQRALQRARALKAWKDGESGVPAKVAAADAGVPLVRFYQMNSSWRKQNSFAAVGVGAEPERNRASQFKSVANQVLQVIVAELVKAEPEKFMKASVRSLALQLADSARERGVPIGDVPGHNTLRSLIERARRDLVRKDEVGSALLLDHAACGLQRSDGAPWTMFVIVDAASQLILGASPGEIEAAGIAYRHAARDGLRRVNDRALGGIPWADRLTSVQLVPGKGDASEFSRVAEEARAIGIGFNVTADAKAGRYLERLVGRSIGVLPIWPGRVSSTSLPDWAAERSPRLDLEQAGARILLAVDDYNAQLFAAKDSVPDRPPPPELARFFKLLSD